MILLHLSGHEPKGFMRRYLSLFSWRLSSCLNIREKAAFGPDKSKARSAPSLQFFPLRWFSQEHARCRHKADESKYRERQGVTLGQIVKKSSDDRAHEGAGRGDASAHTLDCRKRFCAKIIGANRLLQ